MSNTKQNNYLKIALLGNPNAGKSSVFNGLTGLSQKTGNYAGVTVDRLEGKTTFLHDQTKITLSILDLPGVYSLYPKSNDEIIACKTLLDEKENIDVVVIVVDASNLKRNLLLATQVIDLKFKTVVALNMMDEANIQGVIINIEELEKALGVKVIPLDSRHQIGFSELKKAILNAKISSAVFYDLTAAFIKEHGNYKKYISSSLAEDKNATSTQLENADKI